MEKDGEILKNYPKIFGLIQDQGLINCERIESRWRKNNHLLRLTCKNLTYVFKQIGGNSAEEEIIRMRLLKSYYQDIIPEIYLIENDSYLMGHIDGKSFFELDEKEKLGKISKGGEILSHSFNYNNSNYTDISDKIRNSFNRYRKKSERYFSETELRLTDFSVFGQVPLIPSHNDLNAANLLYDGDIKLIDASDEGYNDIARDIGRYTASVFFNQYDYYGNDKNFSLELADSFLSYFDGILLERARYFIGESFISFMNFDTHSTPKSKLKDLATSILKKDKTIIHCLEEAI